MLTTASQSTHNQNVSNIDTLTAKALWVNVCRSANSEMDVIHKIYNFISSIVRSFFTSLFVVWFMVFNISSQDKKSNDINQKNQADWAWLYCVAGVEIFGIHS